MDMFANLLIILPSTDRKELVFGYLIFFQMPVPWEVEVSWQWLMGHFLAKERASHLCLGFLFCLLTAHLLRHSSETETSSDGCLETRKALFLTCCAGLSPILHLTGKVWAYFQRTAVLWPIEGKSSEWKKKSSAVIGFKLWLRRLGHRMVLETEMWKHLDCGAGGPFPGMRRSGNP